MRLCCALFALKLRAYRIWSIAAAISPARLDGGMVVASTVELWRNFVVDFLGRNHHGNINQARALYRRRA